MSVKELDQALRVAERRGFALEQRSSGKVKVIGPKGQSAIVHKTPDGSVSVKATIDRLIKIGVPVDRVGNEVRQKPANTKPESALAAAQAIAEYDPTSQGQTEEEAERLKEEKTQELIADLICPECYREGLDPKVVITNGGAKALGGQGLSAHRRSRHGVKGSAHKGASRPSEAPRPTPSNGNGGVTVKYQEPATARGAVKRLSRQLADAQAELQMAQAKVMELTDRLLEAVRIPLEENEELTRKNAKLVGIIEKGLEAI